MRDVLSTAAPPLCVRRAIGLSNGDQTESVGAPWSKTPRAHRSRPKTTYFFLAGPDRSSSLKSSSGLTKPDRSSFSKKLLVVNRSSPAEQAS